MLCALNLLANVVQELYARRIGSCFSNSAASAFSRASTAAGAAGASSSGSGFHSGWRPTSLFCVCASEITTLRSLEESMGQVVSDMPIDVSSQGNLMVRHFLGVLMRFWAA